MTIDDILNGETIEECQNGKVIKVNDGLTVFLPNKMDTSSVNVYYWNSANAKKAIDFNDFSDNLFILKQTKNAQSNHDSEVNNVIKLFEEYNGTNFNRVNCAGWSKVATNTLCEYLYEYDDYKDGYYVSLDGNPFSGDALLDHNVISQNIQKFKDNNTTVVLIEPSSQNAKNDRDILSLIDNKVNIIYISAQGIEHQDHQIINTDAVKNGLFNLLDGKDSNMINCGIYKFEIYDYENNCWIEVNYSDVYSLFSKAQTNNVFFDDTLSKIDDLKIDGFDNLPEGVKSDLKYVLDGMNSIRNIIKSSNYLNGISSNGGSGFPGGIDYYIAKYYEIVNSALNDLVNETKRSVDTAYSYVTLDNKLSNDISEIGEV